MLPTMPIRLVSCASRAGAWLVAMAPTAAAGGGTAHRPPDSVPWGRRIRGKGLFPCVMKGNSRGGSRQCQFLTKKVRNAILKASSRFRRIMANQDVKDLAAGEYKYGFSSEI